VNAALCHQSKDEMMIEELIADEFEMQAQSRQQAVTEEQQSKRLRQKQRDEIIDELVSLLYSYLIIIVTSGLYH